MITRRRFVRNASVFCAGLTVAPKTGLALAQAVTGMYRNPIMGGDHPDASPIRVGDDFYLTHSSFDYAPGLLIWHSRDLINWRPVPPPFTATMAPYGLRTSASIRGIFTSISPPITGSAWSTPISPEARGASPSISASPPLTLRTSPKTGAAFSTWPAARWPS